MIFVKTLGIIVAPIKKTIKKDSKQVSNILANEIKRTARHIVCTDVDSGLNQFPNNFTSVLIF